MIGGNGIDRFSKTNHEIVQLSGESMQLGF
jgi:hypothetical protein